MPNSSSCHEQRANFMKIVCVGNTGRALPDSYLDPRAGYLQDMEFPLTLGKLYVVYALAIRDNQVWYYVSDDDELYYPGQKPAPLFEVVDNKVSKYWRYAFTPKHLDHLALFAFEEWTSDAYFYDRLTDGNEREVSIFRKIKLLMDSEATLAAK